MTIAILATDGFEQSELTSPRDHFAQRGATVHVVSPESGSIKAWDQDDWGISVDVDRALSDASVEDYDALVLPGGQINPDTLRADDTVVAFIRDFASSGKPAAAICHAPWLLVEAGLANGRRLTSFKSIRTDLRNAGAEVLDEAVVVDDNLITSRNPDDLDDFNGAIERALKSVGAAA